VARVADRLRQTARHVLVDEDRMPDATGKAVTFMVSMTSAAKARAASMSSTASP
jgi:hypothetical protein